MAKIRGGGSDAREGGEGPSSPTLILISSAELKLLEAESTDSHRPSRPCKAHSSAEQ